jgi:hypothetical protein
MASLHFITPKHLDIPDNEVNEPMWLEAAEGLKLLSFFYFDLYSFSRTSKHQLIQNTTRQTFVYSQMLQEDIW